MACIDEPGLCWTLAGAASKAHVSEELAAQQRALLPAAESLSLVLPVPAAGDQVLVEVGDMLTPGCKNLTLHASDRLDACSSQLPTDDRPRGLMCYCIGDNGLSCSPSAGTYTALVTSLNMADSVAARHTHQHLTQLAHGLATCLTPFAASIQEAAACFLLGAAPPPLPQKPPAPISGNSCPAKGPADALQRPGDDSDGDAALSVSSRLSALEEPGSPDALSSWGAELSWLPQDPRDGAESAHMSVLRHRHRPASFLHSPSQPAHSTACRSHPTNNNHEHASKVTTSQNSSQADAAGSKPGSKSSGAGRKSRAGSGGSTISKKSQHGVPADAAKMHPLLLTFADAGLESRFTHWHHEQVYLLDAFVVLAFTYGMWCIIHGKWYNLSSDLPNTWWLLYAPVVPLASMAINHSWYLRHRDVIQTVVIMHVFLQHVMVVAPTILSPQYRHKVTGEPWSSLTRLYPVSTHLLNPFINMVRLRWTLPRHLVIVLGGIVHLPRTLSVCLPQLGAPASVSLGASLVLLDLLLPAVLIWLIERRLRTSFLLSTLPPAIAR